MTYCVAMNVEEGIVGLSDTLITSGREVTTQQKVNIYSPPRGTFFVMTSGLRSLTTGGGAISSPPLISETTGPILKIQAAFESPGKTVEGKQIVLTSGSRVTSQVRSKSKCSTFRAW